jgi:hypothetical protein
VPAKPVYNPRNPAPRLQDASMCVVIEPGVRDPLGSAPAVLV